MMDIYTVEYTHYKHDYNQSCLILLTSCTLVTCDNYITTRVNVPINNYFATSVQAWHIWSCHIYAFSLPIKYDTFNLFATCCQL
jgi:hypothetical protein